MGTIDNGNQKLSYDFREKGQAEVFNKINYKLHSKGIYAGGTLTKVSDSSVEILPFYSVVEDSTAKISIRIETSSNALVSSVSSSTPWIIGRFEWLNTDDNFMDFLAVAKVAIQEDDIIFGFVDYNGATMTTDFDYTQKSWSSWYYLDLSNPIPPFKVVANEPYDTKVLVNIGGPYFYNGNWIQLSTETESPDFTFPISAFGRKDIVALDYINASNSDASISILQGSSTGDLPEVPAEYFPIAIVSLPSGATEVKGEYIEYLNPLNTFSSKETASTILTKIKTVDGAGSNINLDTLGGQHGDWYKDEINEIIDTLGVLNIGLPDAGDWRFTASNDIFVGILYNTNIAAFSSDGISWTKVTLPVSGAWYSITYGNGLFVAVAASSTVAITSPDGVTWTQRTLPASVGWRSVTYGNGTFVAVAAGTSTAASSTDGITWTSRTMPVSSGWCSVTYGSGLFVAVAGDTATNTVSATSPDGITWTSRTLPSSQFWKVVYFANNIFVALCQGTTTTLYSTNGTSWSIGSVSIDRTWSSIVYGNGVFLAVSLYDGSLGSYAKSYDGITWNVYSYSSGTVYDTGDRAVSVTYKNGRFITAPNSGQMNYVLYNDTDLTDTTTWRIKNAFHFISPKVYFQNGMFFATTTSNVQEYSSDGVTWTYQNATPVFSRKYRAYGNGTFVSLPSSGTFAGTSPDGITWTQRTLPISGSWSDLIFANGLFVGVAESSTIAVTSPDGINWTQRTLPVSSTWRTLAYGNNTYVTIAVNTSIAATSPDGITWTQRAMPISGAWLSLAFGNGLFLSINYTTGNYATSPDGITWTSRNFPSTFTGTWLGVTYQDNKFIVVGNQVDSIYYTSNDGISWETKYSPIQKSLNTAIYGNGKWIFASYTSIDYLTTLAKLI